MADLRCGACGSPSVPEQLYCGHCGARTVAGVADLDAYRTSAERFARVEVEPAYRAAHGHTPPLPAHRELARPLATLAIGVVVLVATARGFVATPPEWQVVAGAGVLGAMWAWYTARGIATALRRVRSATQRTIAVITADRFHTGNVWRDDPCGTCDHRVTLRDRDGGSRDLFASGDVMADVAVGDIGIAFVRHDRLVDYRWIDVMAPPLAAGEVPRAAACRSCGAHQPFGPVTPHCAYCAEPLPDPDLGEFGARLCAAAASPEGRAACERAVAGGVPSLWPPLLCLLAGLVPARLALDPGLIRDLAGTSGWLLLIPMILLAPAAIGALWLWWRSAPYRAGRTNQLAVLIRTRRERLRWPRGQGTGDKIRWFATLASPSGARREVKILAQLALRLTPGQVGIAHLRGDWLADFTPVPPPDGGTAGTATSAGYLP